MRALLSSLLLAVVLALAWPLVQVEIATPREIEPFLPASTLVKRAEGLITQELGTVQVLFTPEIVYAQIFDTYAADPQYVLLGEKWRYTTRQSWRAFWAPEVFGKGEIVQTLSVRSPEDDAFAFIDEDSVYLEEVGVVTWEDWLFNEVHFEQPGTHRVRIETRIRIIEPERTHPITESGVEFDVIALYPDESISKEPDTLEAPFEDVASPGWLIDWRAWRGGPCEVSFAEEQPAADAALIAACDALERADVGEAIVHLSVVQDAVEEPWQVGVIGDQVALLAFATDDPEHAVQALDASLDAWVADGSAFDAAIALHNSALAHAAVEQYLTSGKQLGQARSLREQMNDELGLALSWAQTAIFADDPDAVFEIVSWMRDLDLPQTEMVETWLEEHESID